MEFLSKLIEILLRNVLEIGVLMDEKLEFEFNDKIMKALMKKVQDSNTKCAGFEKDLEIKQAELQYLAKLYDEETTKLTKELEDEKKKAEKYENELNESTASLSEKQEEISNLTSKIENFKDNISSMEQEIEKLRTELEGANHKVESQQNIISQHETRILEMTEEIKNKEIIIEEQTTLYEALQIELKEYKGPQVIEDETPVGDRLKCSKCGSVGKDIKVVEDKSKALSYVGNIPMYAKYHVCKRCGFQF
ncbi:MAG: hypothetical protein ACFFHV_14955 [Promethearchaeota archaeon]